MTIAQQVPKAWYILWGRDNQNTSNPCIHQNWNWLADHVSKTDRHYFDIIVNRSSLVLESPARTIRFTEIFLRIVRISVLFYHSLWTIVDKTTFYFINTKDKHASNLIPDAFMSGTSASSKNDQLFSPSILPFAFL